MPTFSNPTSDASEASEALRGLAHASRVFADPSDTYPVIGDLLAGARSLRQVLDQLAAVHVAHQHRITDEDHDLAGGTATALRAADDLHQAANLLDQVHDHLNAAMSASGQIVWSPEHRQVERWIGVVFLQGDEATRVLDLIDAHGVEAGIEHLSGWDFGTETTDAAMVNGDVHDAAPVYAGDRQAETGDYAMTYNPHAGHVALYRRHLISAQDAITAEAGTKPSAERESSRRSMVRSGGWFEPDAITAVKHARGLGL